MGMVDMKKIESGDYPRPIARDNCPMLWLNEEQCEALGITADIKAGTTIGVQAIARVVRATQSVDGADEPDEEGELDVSVSLEIEQMSVGQTTAPKDITKTMYDGEEPE